MMSVEYDLVATNKNKILPTVWSVWCSSIESYGATADEHCYCYRRDSRHFRLVTVTVICFLSNEWEFTG